ncbi:sugar kinase [Microbacterium paraoxydans]|uniref:Sugar kinase n=1 Tax=Microbacterium paraoxydans TaxID=199592 RepID=A0ABS5IM75_9MICO|nr:sugar kinase [Microbacterium paraoxydans]MBS0024053.1 sugar kinase [Microbacterium paraoxydans]
MTSLHPHVVTVGETMGLVTNDRPGPLDAARAHSLSFGGAESNVAIALARLGGRATWVSRLGDDPLGDLVVRELRAEGVAVHAERDPDRPTGLMHKHRRTTAMATVTFWRRDSAASRLSPADLPDALLATADVVHLTGILPGLGPDSGDCAVTAARRARAAGAAVSFDVNHREAVWLGRDARVAYLRLAALADVVFAGEDEAALLVGEGTPLQLAQRLRDLGPREVVIKRGARGAFALDECGGHDVPAVTVDVVDTVGAGDAFVAGYLSLWGDTASTLDRLRRAAAVGAFACTALGDWEGSPTAAELARLGAEEGVLR